MSVNTSIIMGRICNDLELKSTPSNVHVLKFCVAVERKYKPANEERKSDFIDCVAWRNTAEFINTYFKKGSMIAIEGELQTDTYTDKDGNKRKKIEILVDNASFCGSKNESTAEGQPAPAFTTDNADFQSVNSDEDLPF